MFNQQNRWVLNVILVIAVLALIGFSMLPLLNATLQSGQQPTPTPTPSAPVATTPEAQKADLEAQVRGYEMVLQREPQNLTALQGLLDARLVLFQTFQAGDPKAIIDPLEKLAKLKPDQPNYLVLLAQTKEYLNDREGAAQAYRSALNANPGNPYALTGFVNLYLKQKQPEAAIGLLKDTLNEAPKVNAATPGMVNTATVQVLLGEVYSNQKRYSEAIAIYDAAIAGDPRDFRPHLGKARVLVTQGKTADAKPVFEQAFQLAPANYKDAIRKESTAEQATSSSSSSTAPIVSSAGAQPVSGSADPSANPANPVPLTNPAPATEATTNSPSQSQASESKSAPTPTPATP